jgi:hypothetical protein
MHIAVNNNAPFIVSIVFFSCHIFVKDNMLYLCINVTNFSFLISYEFSIFYYLDLLSVPNSIAYTNL